MLVLEVRQDDTYIKDLGFFAGGRGYDADTLLPAKHLCYEDTLLSIPLEELRKNFSTAYPFYPLERGRLFINVTYQNYYILRANFSDHTLTLIDRSDNEVLAFVPEFFRFFSIYSGVTKDDEEKDILEVFRYLRKKSYNLLEFNAAGQKLYRERKINSSWVLSSDLREKVIISADLQEAYDYE